MLKKIRNLFGLCLVVGSSFCFASEHLLVPGLTVDFSFPPNSPQVLTNAFFWTLTANCKVISEDESNDMYVRMLASTGKVNNMPLKKGDEMSIVVHSNDILSLLANPGAQVELTNLGEHTVKAACTA
jgi:hypothetical protein